MKKYVSENRFQWLVVVCCWLIFIGFVSSRALVSIAMVSLLLVSILYYGLSDTLRKYFRRKELWILSFFFFIVLLSGIYSEDKTDWLNWVRIKLPYLALPVSFAPVLRLDERKFVSILYGFIAVIFVSILFVLGNYFFDFDVINDSFLSGSGFPILFKSHISHIRYTLILTFAFFSCLYLLEKKWFLFRESEKWLQGSFLIFSFLVLHVLSVRSGLLALFIGILFLLVRFIFLQKKYMTGGILMLFIFLIPYLAIQYIPSLHNKFSYMRYDMQQFKEGKVQNLSDGVRVISIKGGLEIAKENLWFGVGAGDVSNELQKFYSSNYPQLDDIDRKPIHNQFIWVLAGTGVVGLGIFILVFLFPLLYRGNYKNWLFLILHLILFSSFFTEATLEEQMGTGFYLIFLLLLMNQFKKE